MYYVKSDTWCSRNSYKQENQILLYIEKFINVLLMLHILVIEVSIYHFEQFISSHADFFKDFTVFFYTLIILA